MPTVSIEIIPLRVRADLFNKIWIFICILDHSPPLNKKIIFILREKKIIMDFIHRRILQRA